MFLSVEPDAVYKNEFRRRRFVLFLAIADEVLSARGSCRILDVGGRLEHWTAFADLWAGKPLQVTLANLEAVPVDDPRFSSVAADARALTAFADGSFDLVYSNSVIEHVGTWMDQKRMAAEVRRVAPRHFVQTPNYWFPVEPHFRLPFIHWLPEPWRLSIVQRRACGFYPRAADIDQAYGIVDDARLLTFDAMRSLFPNSEIVRERVGFLTKSLIAIHH
ncbi:MAG: class I SAM-dependent methyltransferase [Rhodoplanes sp.]|uniref:class I SAM-dependent methyltransferase n=1 Tax=Rhodoplanes sp. TaxID=1968906 RepID=UPI0018103187|nr:class I SAM-dependent methyltransferase [Rhodoplanes sp.]NVO15331.1 class I SAM-dependent methyltransferase [Rhodoplanes sp.]